MGWFSNTRQRQVLRLEPSRGARTIGDFLVFLFAGVIATAALVWDTDAWPSDVRQPDLAGLPDHTLLIVAAVAGTFSVLGLSSGVYDLSRWRLSRRVIRASNTPALRNVVPKHETIVATEQAVAPPPLHVDIRKPRQFPKTPTPLHRVSMEANVIGHARINIVYLRLFDNQPRARTFMESAWREFGYVFLLRSATSVTHREFKRARQLQSLNEMFVHDDETFGATLRLAPTSPMKKGRVVLPDVAPTRVRVRDPYGSYPVRAVLCHGDFWRRAVDILLGQVHLAVLDLSGFTERNAATAYELQRIIDRVPIERVMLLCDPQSSRRLLRSAVERAWSQMSADSPNATGGPRTATVAVTDSIQRHRSQQGDHEMEHVRLESSRRNSRRVAAYAQMVAETALHERRPATDTR